MTAYFSDREFPKPRTETEIGANAWGGLAMYINNLIDQGSFGKEFPGMCPEKDGFVVGTNREMMQLAVRAEFPKFRWPPDPKKPPPTPTILDFLEFCYSHIAKVVERDPHPYHGVSHLTFDESAGREEFRDRINLVLLRNDLAYQLEKSGRFIYLAPPVVRELLQSALLRTGDRDLYQMLASARTKYLNPDLKVRLEALEKLWDAWERIKTIEYPLDKKESFRRLLEKVAPDPDFKERVNKEAKELTDIGNTFMIRHSEVGKIAIRSSAQVDYLFHRMFALLYLMLTEMVDRRPASASDSSFPT